MCVRLVERLRLVINVRSAPLLVLLVSSLRRLVVAASRVNIYTQDNA